MKLVAEKEELLKTKHKDIEKMQDKVLRSYAEMENVIDRTKREAENSKKFAIQASLFYLYSMGAVDFLIFLEFFFLFTTYYLFVTNDRLFARNLNFNP